MQAKNKAEEAKTCSLSVAHVPLVQPAVLSSTSSNHTTLPICWCNYQEYLLDSRLSFDRQVLLTQKGKFQPKNIGNRLLECKWSLE